jgi:AbrB family looped-hinge helix DNA binding protein
MKYEVKVDKRGRITIPASLRRKFNIQEGTRLKVVETPEGILFKPQKSGSEAAKRVLKKLDGPPDLGAGKGKLSRADIYQEN